MKPRLLILSFDNVIEGEPYISASYRSIIDQEKNRAARNLLGPTARAIAFIMKGHNCRLTVYIMGALQVQIITLDMRSYVQLSMSTNPR